MTARTLPFVISAACFLALCVGVAPATRPGGPDPGPWKKPDGLHIDMSVSPEVIKQDDLFTLTIQFENRSEAPMSLPRVHWDPNHALYGTNLLAVERQEGRGYMSITPHENVFLRTDRSAPRERNYPLSARIELEPGEVHQVEVPLRSKVTGVSLLPMGTIMAFPGDYTVFYAPPYLFEGVDAPSFSNVIRSSPHQVSIRVDRVEAVPLEDAMAAGGLPWYSALIQSATEEPERLIGLMDRPLEPARQAYVLYALSRVPEAHQDAAIDAYLRFLESERTENERGGVLTGVRYIASPRTVDVLEKVLEQTTEETTSAAHIRNGCVNAAARIDADRAEAMATKAIEINRAVVERAGPQAVGDTTRSLEFFLLRREAARNGTPVIIPGSAGP